MTKTEQDYVLMLDMMSIAYETYLQQVASTPKAKSLLDNLDTSLPVVPIIWNSEDDDHRFPLDSVLKSEYETVFGQDLSDVIIHTGHYAHEMATGSHALALTIGSDVYFADGTYAPDTEAGKNLLAHELSHALDNLKGTRMVYLEDIEAAEYAGLQAETAVQGVGLHSVREGSIRAEEGPRATFATGDTPVEAFSTGIGGSGSSNSAWPSLSDFSARGGAPEIIELVARDGTIYHLTRHEYDEVVREVVKGAHNMLHEARYGRSEADYEAYALRWCKYWKGKTL